jgi:hypothetical protein
LEDKTFFEQSAWKFLCFEPFVYFGTVQTPAASLLCVTVIGETLQAFIAFEACHFFKFSAEPRA